MPAGPAKSVHGAFAIPSLDGIRAIAVMTVFVGHSFTLGGPWPGDVGVTIFFFLSGYLITTLLRREFDRSGGISLSRFYLRRALRILPPAYIAIGLCVAVGLAGWLPSDMTGWGILAELLNYTNYYMIWASEALGSAHAGLPPESSMLWSLAVEEHFYLIFPALLLLLLRKRLTFRTIGWVLVAACVAAPVWRIALAFGGSDFYRLYVATDTRFDGLLAGAAVALLYNPAITGDPRPFSWSARTIRFVASPIAFIVFLAVAFAPSAIGLTIGDSILYMCFVPILWLIVSFPTGLVGRILNHRWVAHIGVLSFSIYLLHRLVLALVRQLVPVDPVADALSLLAVVVLAQLMYVAVEKPLGRLRRRLESAGARSRPREEASRSNS